MANKDTSGTIAADAEIATRIRTALTDAGLSVNALADRAAISQKSLDRSLKGGRTLTVQELGRIAAALNTRAFDLLDAA